MLEFFAYVEVNCGLLKKPLRSGLWTTVRRLSTSGLHGFRSEKGET